MKKRNSGLLVMLIVTTVLIVILGAYLKYVFLVPYNLYREDPVVAVPFMLLADEPAKAK